MKILTEMLTPSGLIKKKKTVRGTRIIIKKANAKRGKPEYSASYTPRSLIPYYKGIFPFRFRSQKLMLIYGADQCIDFYYSAEDQNRFIDEQKAKILNIDPKNDKKMASLESAKVLIPVWDRDAQNRNADATVLKNSGNISSKSDISPMLIILLVSISFIGIINLLVSSGRLTI